MRPSPAAGPVSGDPPDSRLIDRSIGLDARKPCTDAATAATAALFPRHPFLFLVPGQSASLPFSVRPTRLKHSRTKPNARNSSDLCHLLETNRRRFESGEPCWTCLCEFHVPLRYLLTPNIFPDYGAHARNNLVAKSGDENGTVGPGRDSMVMGGSWSWFSSLPQFSGCAFLLCLFLVTRFLLWKSICSGFRDLWGLSFVLGFTDACLHVLRHMFEVFEKVIYLFAINVKEVISWYL